MKSMYTILSNISAVIAVVSFLLVGVLLLKTLISRMAAKAVPQNSIQRYDSVDCFICGNPMEQGFVNVMGNVRWREFDSLLPKTSKYGETLDNLSADQFSQILTFGFLEHSALRCKACSVLTIDHSKIHKIK